jgi:hypothetical protein
MESQRLKDEMDFIGTLITVWRDRDIDRLIRHFDEDVVVSTPVGTLIGRADAELHLAGIMDTLPDLTADLIRWEWDGDELKAHMLYAATIGGRPLTFRGFDRYRFVDGKVVEKVSSYDQRKIRRRMLMSPKGWGQWIRSLRVWRELSTARLAPIRVSHQERLI